MLNKPQLLSYSKALAEKIAADFFENKAIISGSEILKLTHIEQLNYFVLKNLFDKWKEEEAKLRSPYFDYEKEEVKSALKNLLNQLSKNIVIRKEFFVPLLNKAIYDTIYYILSPKDFLKETYLSGVVSRKEFSSQQKFYKTQNSKFHQLLAELEKSPDDLLTPKDLEEYIDKIEEEESTEAREILQMFSSLLKIENEHFDVRPRVEMPSPIVEFDPDPVHDEETTAFEAKPEPVKEEIPPAPVHEPVNEKKNVEEVKSEEKEEKLLTLNDLYRKEQSKTILDLHTNKIGELKSSISFNQRYLFIHNLFNGAQTEYNEAIDELDRCKTYDSAMDYLQSNFGAKYNWDPEKEEVKEFFMLLERKFSSN